MAVDIRENGKVGCAYYLAGEERLLCMEEVVRGGMDIVEKRLRPSLLHRSWDWLILYSQTRYSAHHSHPVSSFGRLIDSI